MFKVSSNGGCLKLFLIPTIGVIHNGLIAFGILSTHL
jgi:hypothetical protein